MKFSKLFFTGVMTVVLLSIGSISVPVCNDCTVSQVQMISQQTGECRFTSATPPSNCDIKLWRTTGYLTEDYYACWVFSDGSFRGIQYNSGTFNPATDILSGTPPTGTRVAFTTACNRYGDDNDKFKAWGGFLPSNAQHPPMHYLDVPASQTLPGPAHFQINTSHGTDYAVNCNQLLLIISIVEDSTDSLPSGADLRLNLYTQNKRGGAIAYFKYNPNLQATPQSNPYPSGDNSYFEFAERLTTTTTQAITGLSPLSSWKVNNNFNGKVKNVYCLLEVPDVEASDEHEIADTFTAKLTDLSQTTTYRSTTKKITIKSSYDPNVITVNKDTSHICGESQEELEYTIRFQNTGSLAADLVDINLDLDPALDKTTLRVIEVGVGHNIYTTPAGATTPALPSQPPFSFSYSTASPPAGFVAAQAQHPTVNPDALFIFSGSQFLDGALAADIEDSKGYVTFTIKTGSAYSSIHNRAGIFFDSNPEIATNLAVTTCMKSSDSIAAQLAACHDELENCKKHQSGNGWMDWLPWIIAGLEFLVLLYLLTRKKN